MCGRTRAAPARVPGSQSGVPLLVAAVGPKALRAGGELADGILPHLAGPRALETHTVPALAAAAQAAGRPAPEKRYVPVIRDAGGAADHMVCVDGPVEGALSLDAVKDAADRDGTGSSDFEAARRAVGRGDPVTLVCTSGATGAPEGVELEHRAPVGRHRARPVRGTAGGAVAEPVRVRRPTSQEGQKPQQIVRRGSTGSVRCRRAMMWPASAGGNRVPVIAQLVQADEDTVRDAIHRFNESGLACLDPRCAGGRPRLLGPDDEDFVVQTATTRPTRLGQPFTRWSLRKLVAYLRKVHGRVILIGREALRGLLDRRGVTFQRTKTWKESPAPDREAKLDRIEKVLDRFPDRVFAFDEFGPLGIRPTAGSCWAGRKPPDRLPATYHRTHGVRCFHGCYSIGDDVLWGVNRRRKAPGTHWPRSRRYAPPGPTEPRST
ncbi:hypothetical protein SUDANB140_00095 [Streptomyces sp. enrichment culture]